MSASINKIQFAKNTVGDEELKSIEAVIRGGWLAQGPRVAEFESKFAEYVGGRYAVAVNSCTAALFLSLKWFGVHRMSKVIAPSLTFTASASTICHCDGKPVFVDVNKETLCLDKEKVEHRLQDNPEINTIVAVHLTGNICDVQYVSPLVNVVHDMAHLINKNCYADNKRAGAMNDIACFSFYATKNMTTAEGGMIVTDDPEAAKWFKLARLHGCNKDGFARYKEGSSWGYEIEFPGWKCNMNDITAAIGLEQLKKLDWMNQERARIVTRYNLGLGIKRTGLHLYPVFTDYREEFIRYLGEQGIACSVHFLPLHRMRAYQDCGPHSDLRETDWIGNRIVSLPLHPLLTNEEVDYVIEQVLKSKLLLTQ